VVLADGQVSVRVVLVCTGRPLGTAEFIEELEQKTRRRLALQRGGRPRKLTEDMRQGKLTFSG